MSESEREGGVMRLEETSDGGGGEVTAIAKSLLSLLTPSSIPLTSSFFFSTPFSFSFSFSFSSLFLPPPPPFSFFSSNVLYGVVNNGKFGAVKVERIRRRRIRLGPSV